MHCQKRPGKIPTLLNALTLNLSLFCVRGTMVCEAGAALFFLHIRQRFVHSLMTSRPDTTQNLLVSIDNK